MQSEQKNDKNVCKSVREDLNKQWRRVLSAQICAQPM